MAHKSSGNGDKLMGAFRGWIRSVLTRGRPVDVMRPLVESMAGMLAATAEEEIGCDEAFALLDRYAEIVRRGDDPAVLLPLVKHHLDLCKDCREELEALLRVLEAE